VVGLIGAYGAAVVMVVTPSMQVFLLAPLVSVGAATIPWAWHGATAIVGRGRI